MIRLENIGKSFAKINALKDISFEIRQGRITILSGADGAGKSTLIKILIGLVKKDTGLILLHGQDIKNDFNRITAIAGYMPERFSLYPDLSVDENLDFFASIYQVPRPRLESLKLRLLNRTGMKEFKKRRARDLSGGMKQKLALSAILLSSPEIIILDEPTTGVDPLSRLEFMDIIHELKEEGKTILLSTPYLDEAEKGDNIVLLKEGVILKSDTIQNLKQTFPARLYRILPEGNIYESLEILQRSSKVSGSLYIKGKYIRYLTTRDKVQLTLDIPCKSIEEESPGLEDIYLFWEGASS